MPVAGKALGVLVGQVGFDREGVVGAVAFEHLLGGLFELGGLLLEVGAGAAPGLAGVAGEFDAVDGEHLAADEALPVTEPEDLAEDVGDGLVPSGDEGGEGCEVGCGVAREGDEGDVFPAGALDRPGADDAAAVGEQDDFEQQGRWVGAGAGVVVVVVGVEAAEIDFVIDQVVQGVFEGAREQLQFEIDGKETRAGVDVFVARHGGLHLDRFHFDP